MASVLKKKLHDVGLVVLLLLASEVLVSFLFWSGTPDDAQAGWHFSFVYLEGRRIAYWVLCFSGATLAWLALFSCIRKFDKARAGTSRPSVSRVILLTGAIVLAAGAEIATSVWYQRQLPWVLSFTMTASYLPNYLWGHLVWWTGVISASLTAWYFRRRWRSGISLTR